MTMNKSLRVNNSRKIDKNYSRAVRVILRDYSVSRSDAGGLTRCGRDWRCEVGGGEKRESRAETHLFMVDGRNGQCVSERDWGEWDQFPDKAEEDIS